MLTRGEKQLRFITKYYLKLIDYIHISQLDWLGNIFIKFVIIFELVK